VATNYTDQTTGYGETVAYKAPCRLATTADLTLSGIQTVDLVATAVGDRVLVKDKANPVENGIYIVATGPWQRAADMDSNRDIAIGTQIIITEGAINSGLEFWITGTAPLNVGSSPIVIEEGRASAGISDLGTASLRDVGSAEGNIPVLGPGGVFDEAVMPAVVISDTFEVASQVAMLALTAQRGDVAVRSDLNKSFILKQTPASTLANWVELRTPTDAVLSVAGKTGAVSLVVGDVSGAAPSARQVATQHSLSGGGDLSADRTLSLAGDTATPGNNKVYGTDGSGVRGWKNDTAASGNWTEVAPVATTSGTSINLGALPAGVTDIELWVRGLSTNGTAHLRLQASVAAAAVTSGYVSGSGLAGSNVRVTGTSGFEIYNNAAANVLSGCVRLHRTTGNTWVQEHNLSWTNDGVASCGGGDIALGGAIDALILTTSTGSPTFDAGSVQMRYR
jgi:hypothetical protein